MQNAGHQYPVTLEGVPLGVVITTPWGTPRHPPGWRSVPFEDPIGTSRGGDRYLSGCQRGPLGVPMASSRGTDRHLRRWRSVALGDRRGTLRGSTRCLGGIGGEPSEGGRSSMNRKERGFPKPRPCTAHSAKYWDASRPFVRRGLGNPRSYLACEAEMNFGNRSSPRFSHLEAKDHRVFCYFQQIQGGQQIAVSNESAGLPESAGDRCEKCGLGKPRSFAFAAFHCEIRLTNRRIAFGGLTARGVRGVARHSNVEC